MAIRLRFGMPILVPDIGELIGVPFKLGMHIRAKRYDLQSMFADVSRHRLQQLWGHALSTQFLGYFRVVHGKIFSGHRHNHLCQALPILLHKKSTMPRRVQAKLNFIHTKISKLTSHKYQQTPKRHKTGFARPCLSIPGLKTGVKNFFKATKTPANAQRFPDVDTAGHSHPLFLAVLRLLSNGTWIGRRGERKCTCNS